MAGSDDRPEPTRDASVDEITEDIERTRHEVSETVSALTDKLDVKGRAQATVADTKDRVTDVVETARHDAVDAVTDDRGAIKPGLPAAVTVVATVTVLLGFVVWRRRRQGGK
jgi:ElaB/YqjD/DUF883 family membrane-anchored ribosome-binding protein